MPKSLKQLIEEMKDTFHREYFPGIQETVVIDSIEQWIKEAYVAGAEGMYEACVENVGDCTNGCLPKIWYDSKTFLATLNPPNL